MAGGVSLGSAYFTLEANSASLIQALNAAEQASKKSVQAISAATGIAEKDVQRLAQTYVREQKRAADASAAATLKITKSYNDQAAAADKAAQAQAKATQSSIAEFASLAKGAIGVTSALTGITVGAAGVGAALSKITEETQKAAQAQFALNALYGDASPIITAFAEKQAEAFGRSRTDAKEAAASVATLARNYALTGAQIQQVLTISANLAAVRGISLDAAAERTASALRGEAEAIEYLGQALQSGALKSLAKMTDEQRKHFETLSDVTKAQIILNALTDQTVDLQGKAAERLNTLGGATGNLDAKIKDLSASIGKVFTPEIIAASNALAGWVKSADAFVKSDFVDHLRQVAHLFAAIGTVDPQAIARALLQIDAQAQGRIQIGPDPGLPGAGPGPTPEQAQAIRDADAIRKQRENAEKDAIAAFVENRKRAIAAVADLEEKEFRRQAKAADDAIDKEKIRLEVEKAARIKALEEVERAAIKSIEAEGRAEEQAFKDQIDRLELEKKARLDAAEAAEDQIKRAVDAEKQRLDLVREAQDRERDDSRRHEDDALSAARQQQDRELEDARKVEDRVADAAQKRELKRLEDLKDQRLSDIDDEIKATEAQTQKAVRNIDRQADRARAKSQDAVRGIERQADKEDERHRKASQNLDDERDAQLALLDVQLRALDAADKSEDAARRTADLQRRIADAQKAATAARGTGTPAEIAAARGDLTSALRVPGNEIGVANARERLVKLAGQGNDAILKADQDLADAQADLAKEGVSNARDAERDKIKAAQDAIKAKADADKRAEDDRNRARKAEVDADKQAEQDKLKSRLDALDKRKQATQDASKGEIDDIRKRRDAVQHESDEAIQVARDTFEAESQVRDDRRKDDDRRRTDERAAQDQQRSEERTAQDRFRADERKAQDESLAAQLKAATDMLAQERIETEAHYNGPTGVITIVKTAMDAAKLAYQARLDDAKLKFAEERDAINAVYRNAGKTGLIDLQDEAARNNAERLSDQLAALSAYKEAATLLLIELAKGWKTLEQAIKESGDALNNLPNAPAGGVNGPIGAINGALVYGPADPTGSLVGTARTSAQQAGFSNPDVFVRQINQESGFNPKARSSAGAIGIAQFMPATARARGVDPTDPVASLIAAAKYMAEMEKRYEGFAGRAGIVNALWGYNAGEGNLQKGILPAETLQYLRTILAGSYGFADGGWIREPIIGRGLSSGRAYTFGEREAEYITPASRMTPSVMGAGPPLPDYRAMGSMMLSAHPSMNGGGTSIREGDINVTGIGLNEVAREIERRQNNRSLLRGVGRGRRG